MPRLRPRCQICPNHGMYPQFTTFYKKNWLDVALEEIFFPSKRQRQSIVLVDKKENSCFGTKKATVAGPVFSITPRLRPRCHICPNHGMVSAIHHILKKIGLMPLWKRNFSTENAKAEHNLGWKEKSSRFRTKKAAVAGPDFSIAPRWRPRCQICPNHGTYVEGPRP